LKGTIEKKKLLLKLKLTFIMKQFFLLKRHSFWNGRS